MRCPYIEDRQEIVGLIDAALDPLKALSTNLTWSVEFC